MTLFATKMALFARKKVKYYHFVLAAQLTEFGEQIFWIEESSNICYTCDWKSDVLVNTTPSLPV